MLSRVCYKIRDAVGRCTCIWISMDTRGSIISSSTELMTTLEEGQGAGEGEALGEGEAQEEETMDQIRTIPQDPHCLSPLSYHHFSIAARTQHSPHTHKVNLQRKATGDHRWGDKGVEEGQDKGQDKDKEQDKEVIQRFVPLQSSSHCIP
jgi:hypothetical protein